MIKNYVRKNKGLYFFLYKLKKRLISFNIYIKFIYWVYAIRRKNCSIFDVEHLCADFPLISKYIYQENMFYGNYLAVEKALKKRIPFNYLIEHGYYFGRFAPSHTFDYKTTVIVTFSEKRKEHLGDLFRDSSGNGKRKVIAIGPYIEYVDEALRPETKKKIKNKYGKILLVLPSHSIDGVKYDYSYNDFIKEINLRAKNFNSVFVCMYWKDIREGRHKIYEQQGYTIVTAGHRNDPFFLNRLKSIISISDYTMSNTIGTHIGYCISSNKPHYLFKQNQSTSGYNVKNEFKLRSSQNYIRSRREEEAEIISEFSVFSRKITERQTNLVQKYWGVKGIKYYSINNSEHYDQKNIEQ
jgi:hypothetical protein